MGVAADAVVFFKEGEVVVPVEEVRAGEAGNSGSYDGDALSGHE